MKKTRNSGPQMLSASKRAPGLPRSLKRCPGETIAGAPGVPQASLFAFFSIREFIQKNDRILMTFRAPNDTALGGHFQLFFHEILRPVFRMPFIQLF